MLSRTGTSITARADTASRQSDSEMGTNAGGMRWIWAPGRILPEDAGMTGLRFEVFDICELEPA